MAIHANLASFYKCIFESDQDMAPETAYLCYDPGEDREKTQHQPNYSPKNWEIFNYDNTNIEETWAVIENRIAELRDYCVEILR